MYHNSAVKLFLFVLMTQILALSLFVILSHVRDFNFISGNKPYRCDVCGKEFISKSHLEIHMYIHAGTKPYTCMTCNKSFTLRSKLNRHKLLHSTSKPYICQQCGKSFRSKESLKIHTFVHSGEKPYKCTQCSAQFNNSSNLNKHLVTHSSKEFSFSSLMFHIVFYRGKSSYVRSVWEEVQTEVGFDSSQTFTFKSPAI